MSYNTNAIDFGERIGKKMATAYKTGDMCALTSASRDLYDARMAIEKNPDSLSRMLIKRDIEVGMNAELASRGLQKRS